MKICQDKCYIAKIMAVKISKMVISPPLSPCRQYTTYGGEELVGRAFRPCALVTVSQIGFSCQLMWLASVWLALASAVETQDQAGAPLYPPSSEDPPTAPSDG